MATECKQCGWIGPTTDHCPTCASTWLRDRDDQRCDCDRNSEHEPGCPLNPDEQADR